MERQFLWQVQNAKARTSGRDSVCSEIFKQTLQCGRGTGGVNQPRRPGQGNRVKEESSFFFEKKAAPALRDPKNFCLLGARLRPERGRKSFLLLFFKKEDRSIACLP
jgi:hypothetical protein